MVPVDALAGTIPIARAPQVGNPLGHTSPQHCHRVAWAPMNLPALIVDHPMSPPPPEPPPLDPLPCPPGCLLDNLAGRWSPPLVIVDLSYNLGPNMSATDLSKLIPTHDSVTHVVCTPRVCGLHGDDHSSITICCVNSAPDQMVDGSSNVCVTGDLGSLLDVSNINPISILVALEGSPTTYDDCITMRGVVSLSLSNGTTYYQPCYYCPNMVETIISPAAVLASSNVFYSWTQEGFRDPTIPGSLHFNSHDGLLSMHFPLSCRDRLYYCNTDVYTVDQDPVWLATHRTLTRTPTPPPHQPPSKFVPTTRAQQVESEVWAV
jgi:hypothetical protein